MLDIVKKFVLSISISVLAITTISSPATANGVGVCGSENFAGGNGSEENPFLVHDQNALNELRDCGLSGYFYRQTQDINLAGTWTPIPRFIGNYDGDNYNISNIVINENGNSVGLFAIAENSTLKNMEILGTVTNSGRETGLLAGTISYTEVMSITAFVDVAGYQDTGGLIGAAYNSNLALITVTPLDEQSTVTATFATTGGVVGFAQNTDLDVIQSNMDVEGTSSAFNIGGIVGVAQKNNNVDYTHNYLIFYGTVTALNEGSYRCGGIAGSTDYAIEDAYVLNSTIICEHLDIGGVAGVSTNSIARSRVEADIEARKVSLVDGESQIGGLIGYWQPLEGDWQISQSSFEGNLKAEYSVGGLVGVMNFANESTSNTYQITQSYVKSVITSNSYSGGFIGTLIYDTDGPEIETPGFTISQSYTSVGFTSESPTFDALVLTAYEINFDSVLWNKSALHSQSVWEADIPGVSYGMMKRPLYWSARGFDLNSVWGMNPEIFDGLPVIRENYEGMSFEVACQIQKFPAIKFAKNSSKLTNAAKKKIRAIAVQLLSSACSNLLLTGHASGKETKKGKKAKNFQLKLSGARALAVSEYLFERLFKVELTLGLSTGGQGAKKLLNKDKTKKQQAANRRVVISTIS